MLGRNVRTARGKDQRERGKNTACNNGKVSPVYASDSPFFFDR
jgi:hypothetical protein